MKKHTFLLIPTLLLLALTALQSRAQSTYEPYTFITLAGTAGSYGSADGTGSAARFWGPQGVAVDSTGNVYVADTFFTAIRKVTPAGVVTTLAGMAYSEYAIWSLDGVAVDSAGNVFMANAYENMIRKVTPAGVVTTFAGNAVSGSFDGTGSDARFWNPSGVAVDSAGNIYVADTQNNTIRKITPEAVVTTLAGQPGYRGSGSADGTGSAARFHYPQGLAVDSVGNVYVADTENGTIRKVTSAGVVTTFAGEVHLEVGNGAPVFASADGTGSTARFTNPAGVAVDNAGNVYVADSGNNTIRKITPAGVVTTLAGLGERNTNGYPVSGSADGTGSAARFNHPQGLAVDRVGNVYVADGGAVRKGIPAVGPPVILVEPESQSAERNPNVPVTFSVVVNGAAPMAYQWSKAGLDIAGATESSFSLLHLQASDDGVYSVVATNVLGSATSSNAVLTTFVRPPQITTQPQDQIASETYSVGFWIDLAGTSPMTYQWRKDASDIAGATNSGYSVASVQASDAGAYSVVVSNLYGTAISSNAVLTVPPGPPYTFITLAGSAGQAGSADGRGSAATFRLTFPFGRGGGDGDVAVDGAGNLYVADSGNNTIRKMTPAGMVTTLAGSAPSLDSQGQPLDDGSGSVDGTGSNARFNNPSGVTVDNAGNVYVADSYNSTIRKITPTGFVTTLAGLAGSSGSADGTGSAARFSIPHRVAVDSAANVYVADTGNGTIRKVTPEGLVTTLAGLAQLDTNGFPVFGSADGTGSAARFSYPSSVAVDGAGNVYVADTGNDTIRKVTPTGVVTTLAGFAGTSGSADGTGSNARFAQPNGLAVDSAGNVYIADLSNNTIRKITPAGVVTTLAGMTLIDWGGWGDPIGGSADGTGSTARFNSPSGVAADGAGNLYVADVYNNMIRKGIPATDPLVVLTEPIAQTVMGTYGVTFSVVANGAPPLAYQWRKDGADITGATSASFSIANVQSTDAGGYSVAVRNAYGSAISSNTVLTVTLPYTFTTLAGLAGIGGSADGTGSAARFALPYGVAVDSAGNVYVADTYNSTIRKVTPAGSVTTLAGLAGSAGSADGTGSHARFDWPVGVAVDSAGNVYVADSRIGTIRKVTPAGVVTTLAGLAGSSGSADGTGSAARFALPYGVAVDSAGNVYVADTYNSTIRKVTPAGSVTTLAGLAGSAGSADGMGSVARFDWPFGVAVDSAGNVYVADSYNSTIRKVTPAGSVTTLAGMAGTSASADGTGSDARFGQPFGLTIDSAGDVYVADSGNNTIRKVTPVGANWVVTTLVGGYGSVDGTGSAVRFGQPFGLAVDSAGDLYVSDDNNTIRKGYLGYPPPRLLTSGPGFGSNAGHFGFNLTGSAGQPVVVEASTDLLNWLPIWTNTFTGTLSFSDPQSGSFSRRFYRTRAP